MKPSLDKTALLIGFYLCLHFHYCLTANLHGQVEVSGTESTSSSISQVSPNNINVSAGDSGNPDDKSVIFSNVHVYKCLGRLHDAEESSVQVPAPFMSDHRAHSFPLKRKELNCKKGRFKVIFQVENEDLSDNHLHRRKPTVKVLKTDMKSYETSSYEGKSIKIMKSGAYLHVGNDFFHPSEYCFDQTDHTTELSLFVCYPECYGQRPCVTKCCAQDQVWDVENMQCRAAQLSKKSAEKIKPNKNDTLATSAALNFTEAIAKPKSTTLSNGNVWTPWLFSRSVDNCVKKVTTFHREQLSVHIQQRLPSCDPSEYKLIPLRKLRNLAFQRFRVLWTGQVIVRDKYGNWSEFTPGRYCIDGMVNFKSRHLLHSRDDGAEEKDYSGEFEDQVLLVCPDQMPEAIQKKPIPLKYALMLVLAAVLLLITALISALLWDKQNVYEWTVCCEVLSMFFLIVLVGIAHTVARKPEKSDFGSIHCILIGAASHFFWLATFCWLFIINFEIWWHFRSLVQLRQSRKWFRFGMYQLVGWGFPFLVVGTGFLLDRTWGLQNEDLDCTNVIVPNYGQVNCYISKRAQGPYLFYPIGAILMCNLIFYLLTVCKMWGYQKKSQAIIQYRSRGQTQPILIFAKLFIVMGVSWIFEIVAWAVTASEVDKIPLYWVIFDMVTLFQAVSIFVIFTWKKEVLSRLWHKFPSCQTLLSPLTKLPGCGILPNERERMASLHQLQYNQTNKIPREQRNPSTVSTGGVMMVPPSSSGYSSSSNSNSHEGGIVTLGGNGIAIPIIPTPGTSSASNSNNNINQPPQQQQLVSFAGPTPEPPVSLSSSSL